MSKETMEAKFPQITLNCRAIPDRPNREGCGYAPKASGPSIPILDTLAGAPVDRWFVIVDDGVATTVMAQLQSREFDRVLAALLERWGKPTERKDSTVQNRMGASFDQTEITWRVSGSVLIAKKRSGKLDHMGLYLSTEENIRDGARQRGEQPKADAKDL